MTTTATPNLAEMDAMLDDPTKVGEMAKNGSLGTFIKDHQKAKMDAQWGDLKTLVKDQADDAVREFIKDSGGQMRRPNQDGGGKRNIKDIARGRGVAYNPKALGAKIDQLDESLRPADLSEYLQAISGRRDELSNSEGIDLNAKFQAWKKIKNAYGSQVPADGGFLVPEMLRSELLQLSLEDAIVRSRATVIPMSSLVVPVPTVDETSRATSLFGGIVAYWTEEGAAATESQAKFGRVRLEAKKLVIYCEAPNELISDSPAFEAFIGSNLPQAIAYEEDYAFLNGSGVGEPLGIFNSPAMIATARTAGGNAIDFADVVNVYSRLLPGSYQDAVWLASPAVVSSLLQMVTGSVGPLWLDNGQVINQSPVTLLGRPLFVTEKVPNAGTRGDLSLIDFSKYLIGDRQMIQAKQSEDFKFSSDVTAFRITERVDGRPWVNSAMTPRSGGTTLSPYVTVAT